MFQGGIARRAEIVAPGKVMDLRSMLFGNVDGAVGGTGVHNDDLGGDIAHGVKAAAEKRFFILDNQADGKA